MIGDGEKPPGGPLSRIPSAWVPLADLMRRVFQVFRLEGDDLERYLIDRLRYRSYLCVATPYGPKIVRSQEWDVIPREDVDWDTGHIIMAGPRDDPDNPPRFSIEAKWEAVIVAVTDWQRQQRNAAAYAARALAPAPKPAPTHEAPLEPTRKPPIPRGKLLLRWKEYIQQHPDPDKRPNVDAQRADMAAAFPDHAPPTERTMQGLRADNDTPPEWAERGRRPKLSG